MDRGDPGPRSDLRRRTTKANRRGGNASHRDSPPTQHDLLRPTPEPWKPPRQQTRSPTKHPKVRRPPGTDPIAGTHLHVREHRPAPNNSGQRSCGEHLPKLPGGKDRAKAQPPPAQSMPPKHGENPPPALISATDAEARRSRPLPLELLGEPKLRAQNAGRRTKRPKKSDEGPFRG